MCYTLFNSMRNILSANLVLFLTLGLFTPLRAEIPEPPKFEDYRNLLKRSPFTRKASKIVKTVAKPEETTNYFLRGVIKLDDKWSAIVVDANDPKKNIRLRQGDESKSGLKLIDVLQSKTNYKETKVTIANGTKPITIGYRLEELIVKPKAPPKSSKSPSLSRSTGSKSPTPSKSGNTSLLPALDANKTRSLPRMRPIIRRN